MLGGLQRCGYSCSLLTALFLVCEAGVSRLRVSPHSQQVTQPPWVVSPALPGAMAPWRHLSTLTAKSLLGS